MKKIDFAISFLALLLLVVSSSLWAPRVAGSDLQCTDLSECCGAASCGGPGQVNGCSLTCTGGGSIACDRKGKDGLCH